jgi:phage shock protein A
MAGLALFLLRLLVWGIVPLLLLAIAIGPGRSWRFVRRSWSWLTGGALEPIDVFNRVVREHEKKIQSLQTVLSQAESTRLEIDRNIERCEKNARSLDYDARAQANNGDDDGARASLAKLNLERLALETFQEQLRRHDARMAQARRRLHLLELQLRQYEVGRSVLLNQLAEARSVEQQYALANQFDPFSAVAEWQKAQGVVQDETQTARAAEQVLDDTANLPLSGSTARLDRGQIDEQLAELKRQAAETRRLRNDEKPSSSPGRQSPRGTDRRTSS